MAQKVEKMLNAQINKELFSAYLYQDFANYFALEGLNGFAHWFSKQAQEEMEHAVRFQNYLLDIDYPVTLDAIAKPERKFKDYLGALEAALEHEKYISASINDIYGEALAAKDYRTVNFLNWFVAEQVEEEKNARDLISDFKLFAGSSQGLYNLDGKLGARKDEEDGE